MKFNFFYLKSVTTKISFILLVLLIISCNAVKKVQEDQHLLTENKIFVNDEEISKRQIFDQLYQEPNAKLPLLGIPLKLHIYNAANPNPDTTFYKWLHKKPKRENRLINWLSKKQVEKSSL